MNELENFYKLNKYFYMDKDQNINMCKKYCIIANCEKIPRLIMKMKKILYIVIIIN